MDLYEQRPDRPLLDSAERVLQTGLDLAPTPWSWRPNALNSHGMVLVWRWELGRDPADLDQAIACFRQASATAVDDGARLISLGNLGSALLDHVEHFPEAPTVSASIEEAEVAFAAVTGSSASGGTRYQWYQLAGARLARHVRESTDELDLVLDDLGRGLSLQDSSDPESWLSRLYLRRANTWQLVAAERGDPTALVSALQDYRQATACETDPAVRAGHLSALGRALQELFDRTGVLRYLDGAVAALAAAWHDAMHDDSESTVHLSNVALVLGERARTVGDPILQAEALQLHRRCVAEAAPGSSARRLAQRRCAQALLDSARFEPAERPAEPSSPGTPPRGRRPAGALDEAVRILESALAESPLAGRYPDNDNDSDENEPNAKTAYALGNALLLRYEQSHNLPDLEKSVDQLSTALAATTERDLRVKYQADLANAHRLLFEATGDQAAKVRAMDLYREVNDHGALTGRSALVVAVNWANWASRLKKWAEACSAYERSLELVEVLLAGQASRMDREAWLREVHELPTQAGLAWLSFGDPDRARGAIERGRGLLLTSRVKSLTSFTIEPEGDSAGSQDNPSAQSRWSVQYLLDSEHAADILALALAAAEPGPELRTQLVGLLGTPTEQRESGIPAPTSDGPTSELMVHICPCDPAGYALFSRGGRVVSTCWLPRLTRAGVFQVAVHFYEAYDRRNLDRPNWDRALEETLDWLWEACGGAIAEHAGSEEGITVVSGGLLGMLPVHAASRPDSGAPGGRAHLIDTLAVSLTPSAALVSSPVADPAGLSRGGLVTIADPQPTSWRRLAWAVEETVAAAAYFPRATRLHDTDATVLAVTAALAGLGADDVLHVACHAQATPDVPGLSRLLLAHDQEWTLDSILSQPPTQGRMVVLSACETSLPGIDLPEEALSFPMAFLRLGFQGVLASQWALPETAATAVLLTDFYRRWREDGQPPAVALAAAQCWLRDTTNGEKSDAYPELFRPPQTGRFAERLWRQARSHSGPQNWAALTLWGR